MKLSRATRALNLQIQNEEEAGPLISPVNVTDRLPSLDVLRGVALLGILVLNIQDFASPDGILHDIPLSVVSQLGRHHHLDLSLMTVQWLFFEGKMRALFSVLFGAGSVLLLDRIGARNGERRAAVIFYRRNAWLLLFGLIHGLLIWYGDILLMYSAIALVALYPLHRLGTKLLLTIGLSLSLLGGTLGIANAMNGRNAFPQALLQEEAYAALKNGKKLTAPQAHALTQAIKTREAELAALPQAIAKGKGSYITTEPDNIKTDLNFLALLFSTGWFLEVAGLLIGGMGLYKSGFLSAKLSSNVYLTVAAVGYSISIPTVLIGLNHSSRFGFSDAVTTVWMFLPYGVEQIACMLANASIVILLVQHRRLLTVQRALTAVGRTAFSNYILTSLACQFLFRWGPWKLYGRLQFYQQAYVVCGIWALNLAFSNLWMSNFTFGPLEWAWRSLTYWKLQPWRLKMKP